MKWKPYPAYKESGLGWLDQVPEGWPIPRMSYLEATGNDFVSGPFGSSLGSNDYVEEGIPVIRGLNTSLNAEAKFIANDFVFVSESKFDELSRCDAIPNDLIFTARGTVGKVGIVPSEIRKALISPNQLRFRPTRGDLDGSYIYYLFSSHGLLYEITLLADSVAQPNLNLGNLKSIRIPLPSNDQQTAIVSFLDRETAKLDTLISKQERLIELLQEKRQAIISHAVTKGLDLDVPMKDSGIEWLDMVPAHWDSVSLKWVATIFSGGTPDKSKTEYWEDGTIPWLNSGSVNQDLIIEPSEFITEDAFANSSAKWIPKNSLVIALAGQGKTKGMVAQLAIDTTCNQSMAAIIPNSKYEPRFLFWWLKANYQNIRNLAGGDLRDGLNLELVGSIRCPLCSCDEQVKIYEYLDKETSIIDRLIDKARKSIELAKEHRSALIYAAVTGKIDVREAA